MSSCNKVAFYTWEEANTRLWEIIDADQFGPVPRYIYRCPQCHWYHLTKTAHTYQDRQRERPKHERLERIKREADYWTHRLRKGRRKW